MRITDNKTGLAYLAENDRYAFENVVGDKVVLSARCGRCGGSGRGPWFQDGGICYACHGANTMNATQSTGVKAYAQGVKRRITAAAKRKAKAEARAEAKLDRQRDWCEANGHGRLTFAELDVKRAEQREAEKQSAEDCPEGRVEISGVILKTEAKTTAYGVRFVMTVKASGGFLVWGSIPSGIDMFEVVKTYDDDYVETIQDVPRKGDAVTFTATIERSGNDSKFGFYKRPAKASIQPLPR